jgi:hypothetical protein
MDAHCRRKPACCKLSHVNDPTQSCRSCLPCRVVQSESENQRLKIYLSEIYFIKLFSSDESHPPFENEILRNDKKAKLRAGVTAFVEQQMVESLDGAQVTTSEDAATILATEVSTANNNGLKRKGDSLDDKPPKKQRKLLIKKTKLLRSTGSEGFGGCD